MFVIIEDVELFGRFTSWCAAVVTIRCQDLDVGVDASDLLEHPLQRPRESV